MTWRPDKNAALGPLRPFQRSTVEHVVRRLLDPTGSQRFLVADELGLGKTLVARGVIAELIDHHWDKRRIDIVYVCSNSALARENLVKLRTVGDDQSKATAATRLTLLARKQGDQKQLHDKLNFISLTPETAIRTRGGGIHEERQVLFHLMREMQDTLGEGRWLSNLLRGQVDNERWRRRLKDDFDGDENLAASFREKLRGEKELLHELEGLREAFARVDSNAALEASGTASRVVGRLRNLLAQVCIDALEPDLVVLDEFQRFKTLLVTGEALSDEAELANQLFSYRATDNSRVALLLLSATPYRMFTTNEETATEDHHADFLDTVRFLLEDEQKFTLLKGTLTAYRRELLRATKGESHDVPAVRRSLEQQLLQVMSRHERVGSTSERDAMVTEPKILAPVEAGDVAQYLALAKIGQHLESRDLTELWKSAPYLLNFAKGYEFNDSLDERRRDSGLRAAFEQSAKIHLSEAELRAYAELDPSNGRLRALAEEALGNERWRMLWLPPSLPYWPGAGPWKGNEGFTKKLLFSAWNVVPDAVSALLSYEVERRMTAPVAKARVAYEDFYRKRTELLRFGVRNGKPAGMTTLSLQVPCLRLADFHPLSFGGGDVREAMREQVTKLLSGLRHESGEAATDRSWYWAAPLLLDDRDEMTAFLTQLASGDDYDGADDGGQQNEDQSEADVQQRRRGRTGISVHVQRALQALGGELQLGAFPDDLADVLVEHALGNPAILWARTLAGFSVPDLLRRRLGAQLADALRSLFNEPPVVEMLHQGDEAAYWRTTLHYAFQGNLQAVLDEYAHQLWEPEAWASRAVSEIAERVTAQAVAAITAKTSRVRPQYFHTKPK